MSETVHVLRYAAAGSSYVVHTVNSVDSLQATSDRDKMKPHGEWNLYSYS